jgi:hypothetical protein
MSLQIKFKASWKNNLFDKNPHLENGFLYHLQGEMKKHE